MVNSLGMSFATRSSSSSVAESNLNEDSTCLLVEQLKVYSFGTDLFQALKQDPSIESDIRKLLRKLSVQKMPKSAVPFLSDFDPLESASPLKFVDLLRHKADNSTKECDLSIASQQKVDTLEAKAQKDKDQLSAYT